MENEDKDSDKCYRSTLYDQGSRRLDDTQGEVLEESMELEEELHGELTEIKTRTYIQ